MTIIPFDRRAVAVWAEAGAIPDDQSTREFAAQLCARLLREYDELIAMYVAHVGQPVPSVQRRNPRQPELFAAGGEQ